MIKPPYLKTGDTVCIVPTARFITAQELAPAMKLLNDWGLQVKLATNVGQKENQQAGTDQERISVFNKALNDPQVHAIWCARGGYGTVRMLCGVDQSAILNKPKWMLGFSDVTALHNLYNSLGIMSLHAQMPFAVDRKTQETLSSIQQNLFGTAPEIAAPAHPLNKAGTITAELVGGNLSVLYSLRGSKYDLSVAGKILFLEDLDELLYHVDRMAQNLHTSDWGERIAGLVVGGLTKMWDKNPEDPFGKTAEEIILEAIGYRAIPVAFGLPVGHADDNRTLVLGQKTTLSVGSTATTLRVEQDGMLLA